MDQTALPGHVLVVGYGRVGRRIADSLGERSIPVVVAEQNCGIVERLRLREIPAVSGDASDPGVLIQDPRRRADVLVLAAPEGCRCGRSWKRERPGSVFLPERELAIAMA